MSELSPDRRAVVKTAAWVVPAVSVAAAAPSLAASPVAEPVYQNVIKTFWYTDDFDEFVTVKVTANNVPRLAPGGATLLPMEATYKVTYSQLSTSDIKQELGNPAKLGGLIYNTWLFDGTMDDGELMDLTITPLVRTPAVGQLIVEASGTGSSLTVPAGHSTGAVNIHFGLPFTTLLGYNEDDTPLYRSFEMHHRQQLDESYLLATFLII